MTVLRTRRLVLRRAGWEDLDAIHRLLSDPLATRYWSTPPHAELEQTRAWLRAMIEADPAASDDFVVEHQGEVIGKLGAFRLPEIGFILRPDRWGQGLASEALAGFIEHLVASRDLPALVADVDPRNAASLGLLRRFGFVETGRAERTYCIAGEWVDSVYLELELGAARGRGGAEGSWEITRGHGRRASERSSRSGPTRSPWSRRKRAPELLPEAAANTGAPQARALPLPPG